MVRLEPASHDGKRLSRIREIEVPNLALGSVLLLRSVLACLHNSQSRRVVVAHRITESKPWIQFSPDFLFASSDSHRRSRGIELLSRSKCVLRRVLDTFRENP
jgi:hypothetical protein